MTETTTTTLYCYAHPGRETSLRCKRCERPICTSCAVRTPTGYMCKDCVRTRRKSFDTALWYDFLAGFATTFFLSSVASILLVFVSSFIGFFIYFIAIGLAGGAGVFIANMALRATGKRRSRPLFITCTVGALLPALLIGLFLILLGNMYPLIALGIYAFVATPTVYTRLSGIQLFR